MDNCKTILMLIACLFIIVSHFVDGKILNSDSTRVSLDHPNKIQSQNTEENDSPVTIYYGLNESHSKDWAQIDKNGVVGITYFQRFENSLDEGTLFYQSIHPDGSTNLDTVTTGKRLEISVLLFDSLSNPHIFVASSTDYDQIINHYQKNGNDKWQSDTIIHFQNEGGKFIYELSADMGPGNSFHFLILKTRSNIDSDDFFDAYINSHLYHLTNVSGSWQKELIYNYDMVYTYDMYIKTLFRQDMKVDKEGYVYVTFGEQINGDDYEHSPSRLYYATNKTGNWVIETVLNNYDGVRDDAGWFPSLYLNDAGTPYISCMYLKRVPTGSAAYCKLLLVNRISENNWHSEIIAEYDDGYHGTDGRNYTGALSHLIFDKNNIPHIIFSDVASSHWAYQNGNVGNVLLVGNIRYGVFENGAWRIKTIYNQPLPTSFVNATEMHGMCLLLSEKTDTIRVIGQELKITGWENQYTCRLVNFAWEDTTKTTHAEIDHSSINQFKLFQNYPNPFNPTTKITYSTPQRSFVSLKVYDVLGNEVMFLVNKDQLSGIYEVKLDAGILSTGVYFYELRAGNFVETKKMILIK